MGLFDAINAAEVMATIFYTFLGLGLFVACYQILDWLTPMDFHLELSEKTNTALAIVIGSVMIALAILISAVIRS